MVTDILQLLGALLGVIGAPLVASPHAALRRTGFGVWMGSNAFLIAWASIGGAWALVGMQVFFCWWSWRGRRNNRDPQALRFERIGFHRSGQCWSALRVSRTAYYSGDMVWWSWWRFYVVFSRLA